ncbi:Acyl-CoA dehydrogenase [Allopseudospirillum japonicum]|uniref:Acyl-CoA dehydrogenase n=1 Tax=Allopseudospirillum japonicum TaxID=64971 RepID=A0A1H6U7F7_9GAMM|nr:acyl-CoA dehydrogenase family protein [Allopseudospirillum japonicum]SEI84225.1 Acyl-CoA dehydrogenase [Allopseudospirillum japonicum]
MLDTGLDLHIYGEDAPLMLNMVQKILQQEVAPHFEAWEAACQLPRTLWNTLGQAGLLGVDMPAMYGGAETNFSVCAMICEEISRQGFGGLASGYNIHANIVMPYILHLGTQAQKQAWLPAMIRGEVLGAIAMTEPHAGSDLAALKTQVVKVEKGWRLQGSKIFITNGVLADLVIVCAKTDLKAGAKGISLFLVPADSPGFYKSRGIRKIGQHTSDTAELFFDNVFLPEDALLGELNQGFIYLMEELPRERLGVAAQALGAIQGAIQLTFDYVKNRQVFGKKLSELQNTRFKLAEIYAQFTLGRAYFNQCLQAYVEGNLSVTDAAILKLKLTEMQCAATDECLQLFGGYGYTQEYPISRFYVDARIQTIYAGTSEIMKEVIARSLLGK